MRKVKVAAVQMRCTENVNENIANAEKLVREAAADGAQIILLPELFERQYFCQERRTNTRVCEAGGGKRRCKTLRKGRGGAQGRFS